MKLIFNMSRKAFYIISGNTPGLRADAAVVAAALRENFECKLIYSRVRNLHCFHKRWLIKLKSYFGSTENIGIFLENIPSPWMGVFKRFVIIPNQEWIRPVTKQNMKYCEQIWCKTHYAESLLRRESTNTKYIGFTSKNFYNERVAKNYNEFLHVPGRSSLKGTEKIFEVWVKHPEWPNLTVVTKNLNHAKWQRGNIKIITKYLSDDDLSDLMNSIGLHICTSETEGFGHYLNEACAVQAVVITTNAPPMNELISAQTGFLVKYSSIIQQGISERFSIDVDDFEKTIIKIISLPLVERIGYGKLAGASYHERDFYFKNKINEIALSL